MVTYDSGTDGHYLSEAYRQQSDPLILRISSKRVGVANGGTSGGKYVTKTPFPQLSQQADEADKFEGLPTLLMSVGKTADDDNVSVFIKVGVSVYKEHGVLITCKGELILVVKRDERGRYQIPLVQNRGQWQPRKPTKKVKKFFPQANNVYNPPLTDEEVKWMHAV